MSGGPAEDTDPAAPVCAAESPSSPAGAPGAEGLETGVAEEVVSPTEFVTVMTGVRGGPFGGNFTGGLVTRGGVLVVGEVVFVGVVATILAT